MAEIYPVDIDDVIIGSRLRQVNLSKVDVLAESMGRIGQQSPITVWVDEGDDDGTGVFNDQFHLVAGLHRIEAAKQLGWETIDYIETDLDEIDRELWQLDENFSRAELTKAEVAQHFQRRKELSEARKERDLALDKEVAQLDDDLRGCQGRTRWHRAAR